MTRPQRERQRFNKRNNTFACASCFFVYFLVVTAWLRRENAEIPRFMENVNKQQRNIISLSELGYGPLEFNFRRVRLHFTKYVGRNNCEKDWKNANWLLSNILVAITSLDLKVPTCHLRNNCRNCILVPCHYLRYVWVVLPNGWRKFSSHNHQRTTTT